MTAPAFNGRIDGHPSTLEDLLAREAIRDCIFRYCHGIDRRDRETLRNCYWPDAVDNHGSFNGNAYEFIDVILPFLDTLIASSHSVANILLRVDGATARGETHFRVFHREPGQDGAPDYDYESGGRYLDRFERRGGEWRFTERNLIRDWYQITRGTGDWTDFPRTDDAPRGSSKAADPSSRFFGTLAGAINDRTAVPV